MSSSSDDTNNNHPSGSNKRKRPSSSETGDEASFLEHTPFYKAQKLIEMVALAELEMPTGWFIKKATDLRYYLSPDPTLIELHQGGPTWLKIKELIRLNLMHGNLVSISSSEAAKMMGYETSAKTTFNMMYEIKRTHLELKKLAPNKYSETIMNAGSVAEPLALAAFLQAHVPQHMVHAVYHPGMDLRQCGGNLLLSASPDAILETTDGLLMAIEVKTWFRKSKLPTKICDVPTPYVIQLMLAMHVFGLTHGVLTIHDAVMITNHSVFHIEFPCENFDLLSCPPFNRLHVAASWIRAGLEAAPSEFTQLAKKEIFLKLISDNTQGLTISNNSLDMDTLTTENWLKKRGVPAGTSYSITEMFKDDEQ